MVVNLQPFVIERVTIDRYNIIVSRVCGAGDVSHARALLYSVPEEVAHKSSRNLRNAI